MTSNEYQQQFNKQLSQQLSQVRKQQPNHIPVYAMKYKNASKYLVEDLKQQLALFPKKYKLKSVYDIIQKQSLAYCRQKLIKTDSKVIKQGDNFKIPGFYLYTIQMVKNQQQQNQKQSPSTSVNNANKQKPIGKFVKLDLEITFDDAFAKYGRQNVLTIVYTDAQQVRHQYTKTQRTVQKWVQRILIFVLILIVIPFLMRDQQSSKVGGYNQLQKGETKQRKSVIGSDNKQYHHHQQIFNNDDDDRLDTSVIFDELPRIDVLAEKTVQYDDDETM